MIFSLWLTTGLMDTESRQCAIKCEVQHYLRINRGISPQLLQFQAFKWQDILNLYYSNSEVCKVLQSSPKD